MGRPRIFSDEERKARKNAHSRAKKAAMTDEERETSRRQQNAAQRRYYASHTEEVKAKAREHWAKPEIRARELARQKARWESDPEHWRAYSRAARLRNIDTHKAATKRWVKRNRHATVLYVAKRRARLAGTSRNDVTPEQRQLVLDAAKGRCIYCPAYNPRCRRCPRGMHMDLSVDHISPVGPAGPNTLHNLVACCKSCNSAKRRKPNPVPVQPLLL